jgi:hypothetical protein
MTGDRLRLPRALVAGCMILGSTRGPVTVQRIEIITCAAGIQYQVDHFQVLASLALRAGR